MENASQEMIRGSLNEYGYLLFLSSRDIARSFEGIPTTGSVKLDYTDRKRLKVVVDDYTENPQHHLYGSAAARGIVSGLFASRQHGLWRKPVDVDDFKVYTSNAFTEYSSLMKLEKDLTERLKSLELTRREVKYLLERKWFTDLYNIDGSRISLRCGLKEVVPPLI